MKKALEILAELRTAFRVRPARYECNHQGQTDLHGRANMHRTAADKAGSRFAYSAAILPQVHALRLEEGLAASDLREEGGGLERRCARQLAVLIVLAGYVLINGSVQNFLQPKMMGAGLNLSPFAVILSLFFWGWVLGPIMGAPLAAPLTMFVKEVFLEAYDDTRGLAELMSAESPSKGLAPDAPAN